MLENASFYLWKKWKKEKIFKDVCPLYPRPNLPQRVSKSCVAIRPGFIIKTNGNGKRFLEMLIPVSFRKHMCVYMCTIIILIIFEYYSDARDGRIKSTVKN